MRAQWLELPIGTDLDETAVATASDICRLGQGDELGMLETPQHVQTGAVKVFTKTGPVMQFSRRRGFGEIYSSTQMVKSEQGHATLAHLVNECTAGMELQDVIVVKLSEECDRKVAEVADLRAALQDTTSALTECQQQLKTAMAGKTVMEQMARADVSSRTRSFQDVKAQLKAVQRQNTTLESKLLQHMADTAVQSDVQKARLRAADEWAREVASLRAQLEVVEAKAAAACARAGSADEISKMHDSNWRSHWEVMKAQKEDAEGRAASSEQSAGVLSGQLAEAKRELVDTQVKLREALVQKTAIEVNSIIGENVVARKRVVMKRDHSSNLRLSFTMS